MDYFLQEIDVCNVKIENRIKEGIFTYFASLLNLTPINDNPLFKQLAYNHVSSFPTFYLVKSSFFVDFLLKLYVFPRASCSRDTLQLQGICGDNPRNPGEIVNTVAPRTLQVQGSSPEVRGGDSPGKRGDC